MKIFVTGATGFIGMAVASNFARAGHAVYGLARTPEKARRLEAAEILPVMGDMGRPQSYSGAADQCQVLIHCAAEYSEKYVDLDRKTTGALLESAARSGQPRLFIYTSGVWLYGNTGAGLVDESMPPKPLDMLRARVEAEDFIRQCNRDRVRTLIIRPGCVYGGSGSLTSSWFRSAKEQGAARMVGDGNFRWAMVHHADLAELYRLAAESNYGGEVFNGTDRSRFTVLECAAAASQAAGAGGKVEVVAVEDAAKNIGPMAQCLVLDQNVDSSKAARLLGWTPRHPGFVDGAERYYAAWNASL